MKCTKLEALNEMADPTIGGVSYTVQGTPGYIYAILPLSHNLEQRLTPQDDSYYIYPGCTVTGVGANNPDKHFTGQVVRIVKNGNGEVQFLYIKTQKTNRLVTIRADKNLKLMTFTKPTEQRTPPTVFTPSKMVGRLY